MRDLILHSFLMGRSDPDSGVVTDSGAPASPSLCSPALSTRLSLLSPSASPSVSLDNLYLGEEAASEGAKPASGAIGALTIAEYEGSPRRYCFSGGAGELYSCPGTARGGEEEEARLSRPPAAGLGQRAGRCGATRRLRRAPAVPSSPAVRREPGVPEPPSPRHSPQPAPPRPSPPPARRPRAGRGASAGSPASPSGWPPGPRLARALGITR